MLALWTALFLPINLASRSNTSDIGSLLSFSRSVDVAFPWMLEMDEHGQYSFLKVSDTYHDYTRHVERAILLCHERRQFVRYLHVNGICVFSAVPFVVFKLHSYPADEGRIA